MKKYLLYILAFFLLPLYPVLKMAARKIGEKVRLCENVVVVTESNGTKRIQITQGG